MSDIYRAWATSESSSLAATRELVRRDVEQFVQDYHITSADQLMDNTEFKEALTERFKRRLSANEFLLDIDLQLDQPPYIHVQSDENQTDLETRQVFASILLGNEQRQHFVWTNPEEPETEAAE